MYTLPLCLRNARGLSRGGVSRSVHRGGRQGAGTRGAGVRTEEEAGAGATPQKASLSALWNPVARGAMGIAVGGVLAKQAVKAGDKWKERRKGDGKGEHKAKGHADDEILVTLAGMALGGVGLLSVGDKYKEKKKKRRGKRGI
ncbi:hypothetical protein VC83_07958 [Pseudogymnoascus destructans]|uniref:Uncharacterized protein n=1 Tax=Pseudogymnoascus destructans TaxID=655981 RepID=A0A177A177_9PEZI|nr:uncharacterized protein VC83_07958 [Pseudogymnoascus destructans]OAF55908.1 hypothetical protein VC83_07958 [Pseudogymnoascus destructans]